MDKDEKKAEEIPIEEVDNPESDKAYEKAWEEIRKKRVEEAGTSDK